MAACERFRQGAGSDRRAGSATMPVELAKRHLVQPWPFAGVDRHRGAQPDRQRRRHLHHRRRGQAADRRAGRHVVRQCRPPPRGAGARDVRPGDGALLQHALVHDERAVGGACRAHRRPCAAAISTTSSSPPAARRRSRRAALHAVLQQCARPAREEADPVARRRLSRLDLSVGLAQRASARPRLDGRRRRAGGQAVVARPVPPAGRHERRGVLPIFWSTSSATRWRRIGADRIGAFVGEPVQASGGVIVPPPGYLHAHPRDLPRQRHPLHLRRGGDGLRPARPCLRVERSVRASIRTSSPSPRASPPAISRSAAWWSRSGCSRNCAAPTIPTRCSRHGLTYTSHPVGCAVALKNLDLLEGGILEHARADRALFPGAAENAARTCRWSARCAASA